MELIIDRYIKLFNIHPECIVRGRGHRKTSEQRTYDKLVEYTEKLKKYAIHINTCGDNRNSYSKTDNDATFFRMKRDYMGNDQLLSGYNIQFGVCDEYIAVCDIKQYASDMDCFIPLMEKYKKIHGFHPKYPVADAGYGSFNNYLYCEENGMEKYMKFTMFEKESKDEKHRDNPYRAVNFPINENGKPVCPNGKEFNFLYTRPVKGNKYGRTEELYQCEDCTNCSHWTIVNKVDRKNRKIK
ncbi:MAG: transposase [Ruminococcus bromii]|nr:transposase [Ruminococcus bromii]